MEIVFVREKQNSNDILSQVRDSVIARIQQAVNLTESDTETYILPVVPKNNPFKNITDLKKYKGLSANYTIPDRTDLKTFSWSSIFPVNKNYAWQHAGSNLNGYDYVDFIQERQNNELPFRLIAFDRNTALTTGVNVLNSVLEGANGMELLQAPIRNHFDGFVMVKEFEYDIDSVKDIKYTITLEEFNTDILRPIDWTQAGVSAVTNIVTKYALKTAGLI